MDDRSRRQRNYWHSLVASAILALTLLFGVSAAIAAVPPPANSWWFFKPEECKINLTAKLIDARAYRPSEVIPIEFTVKRLTGHAGQIRTHFQINEPPLNGVIQKGEMGPSTGPLFTVESEQPNFTATTTAKINIEQQVTGIVNLTVNPTAPQGTYDLKIKSSSLKGGEAYNCIDNGILNLRIVINNPEKYDLITELTPETAYATVGDEVTFIGKMLNSPAAKGDLPANLQFSIKYETPIVNFKLVRSSPTACQPQADRKVYNCGTITAGQTLKPGEESPVKFEFTIKVEEHADLNTLRLTLQPTTEFGRANELNPDNNDDTSDLIGIPYAIKKTWSDGLANERIVQADQRLRYQVSISNQTNTPLTNLRLYDLLISDTDCNNLLKPQCPPWDKTVQWVTLPNGVIAKEGGALLEWRDPITLNAKESKSFDLEAKVVGRAELITIVERNRKFQARCNVAQVSYDRGATSSSRQAKVCWRYDLRPNLNLSKRVSYGGQTSDRAIDIPQGQVGSFRLEITNTGDFAAYDLDLVDRLREQQSHSDPSGHFVRWLPGGAGSQDLVANDQEHTLKTATDRPRVTLGTGESKVYEQRFAIACDAIDRIVAGDNLILSNIFSVKAINDSEPRQSNEVSIKVNRDRYNLGSFAAANPASLDPGDTGRNTTTLTISLTNSSLGEGRVTQPVPDVTLVANIPSEFEIVEGSIGNGGSFNSSTRELTWSSINVPKDQIVERSVRLRVKAEVIGGSPDIKFKATSASHGQTCGVTNGSARVNILGVQITGTKSVIGQTITPPEIGLTDQAEYQIRITNNQQEGSKDLSRPRPQALIISDPLPSELDFVAGSGSCQSDDAEACATAEGPNYDAASRTLSWGLMKLKVGKSIDFRFKAAPINNFAFSECPQPVTNGTSQRPVRITDPLAPERATTIAGVRLSVYPDKCLKGNIFSRNRAVGDTDQTTDEAGIIIQSPNLVIDQNSILSARGTIDCRGNTFCESSPYRVAKYHTNQSIGLDFERVALRMGRNIARLQSGASVYAGSSVSGNFNLFSGGLASGGTGVRYPDGRVWLVDGDLILDTTNGDIIFSGQGTFIVRGDLKIVGGNRVRYSSERGKHTVGFIVLYDTAKARGGNIVVEGGVRSLIGAYFAPGLTENSGVMTFAPGEGHLRSAKGLFIARQFILDRNKLVLEYDPELNAGEKAPPGFTFTVSPSQIKEGS